MFKRIIYLTITFAIVFYALPRIQLFSEDINAQIFSFIWIMFGLLIIGAQLDKLLFLDEKKKLEADKLKRYKIWEKEQLILKQQKKQYSYKSRY